MQVFNEQDPDIPKSDLWEPYNTENKERYAGSNVARIVVEVEWTPAFCWYLIPTIEINTSVKEVAINILCLGIYFGWGKSA